MILDDLVIATKKRVERQRQLTSLSDLKKRVQHDVTRPGDEFMIALSKPGLSVIAEIKKASPSKGQITNSFDYLDIAKKYAEARVDAISVLTEPEYFKGSLDYLTKIAAQVKIPLLRKDFTISEYMIYQAKAARASAILLIVAILTQQQLEEYLKLADELGLAAIVETHDEKEVKQALQAGAQIIGVNNRNLKDFSVDLNNSLQLRKLVPENIVFVAESGIKTAQDLKLLANANVDAVLIGETLMRATDKKACLTNLLGEVKEDES